MKVKKVLALSLLALGAVGVASCDKKDKNNDNGDVSVAKYSVTYNTKGHGTAPANLTDVNALPAELPQLSADGFAFKGWFLDEACTQAATAGAAINGNTTLYAKWEKEIEISFNTNGGNDIASIKGSTLSGLPVPTKDGCLFAGWYTDSGLATAAVEGAAITSATTLYAKWIEKIADKEATDAIEISTAEQLLEFRKKTLADGETKHANYKLMNDIDLDGVTLDASTIEFDGVFDGNGYVIKNAVYSDAASKSGILVAKIVNGGIIKNVKFLGCKVSSSNESPAIVAGEINGGGYVKNIEINSCAVESTGNYGGLIYARSEGSADKEVVLEGITIKNNSYVSCSQYGGLITGDNTANVSLINSQISGELRTTSNNFGLLLGRTRNDAQIYRVENVIASVIYTGTGGSSAGFVSQGKNAVLTVARNVLVLNSNKTFGGAKGKVVADNVYYLNNDELGKLMPTTNPNVKAVAEADVTANWYKNTLLDDFDNLWEVESNGGIKLKVSSKNTVDASDVLKEIKLSTGNTNKRFKKGNDFSVGNIAVSAIYESGVQIMLTEDQYEIDSSSFNKDVAGEYTITVRVKNTAASATYNVYVVEQTGFVVDDQFTKKTYIVGEDFDASGLIVYGKWSDGKQEKLTSDEYTIDISNFDKNQAGEYIVYINSGDFTRVGVNVTAIAAQPTVVDNQITLSVDASYTGVEGSEVEGVQTFKTISNALSYIKSAMSVTDSLVKNDTKKVINIKDGVYREKITLDINNVEFVGESREGTKIVYDAVESTVDPTSGKQYVLNCATLHVNASGFKAKNISIYNDFDYKNNQYNKEYASVKESSPQGLALTLNGDMFILDNCHLYGNQDTLYLKSGRTYINGGIVEGNIDFIFGEAKGIAFFNEVNINAVAKALNADDMKNNGYVTAMKGDDGNKPNYGVVFSNCNFTSDENVPAGSMSLGRPWGKRATVAYINCSFDKAYSKLTYDGKAKSRWYDMSGNNPSDADFVEYGSTGEGAITTAVAGGRVITAEEAAKYTMANTFAKTNGSIVWTTEWDPTSDVQPVDNSTYYMFNGQTNPTGTSYKYDQNVQNSTLEWNGLSIDASSSKVTARASDTQINAGATITFSVQANTTVTVETYPGYHGYSLNGVETTSDTFSQFYATTTTVTFEAISAVYLYKIVISPNQTAPAAATVQSLEVKGVPDASVSTGTDIDLSKLSVKAIMSDSSIKKLTSTEYTVDTSKVNKDAAGTYTVTVEYNGVKFDFQVTYVEGEVDTKISAPLILDFKGGTFASLIADEGVDNNVAGDIDASTNDQTVKNVTFKKCVNNGKNNWLKVDATTEIVFEVSGPCTVHVAAYNGTTPSLKLDGTDVTATTSDFNTESKDYAFTINEAGTVSITFTGQYVGAIGIGGF